MSGKVAIVTGGNKGIGYAIVKGLDAKKSNFKSNFAQRVVNMCLRRI